MVVQTALGKLLLLRGERRRYVPNTRLLLESRGRRQGILSLRREPVVVRETFGVLQGAPVVAVAAVHHHHHQHELGGTRPDPVYIPGVSSGETSALVCSGSTSGTAVAVEARGSCVSALRSCGQFGILLFLGVGRVVLVRTRKRTRKRRRRRSSEGSILGSRGKTGVCRSEELELLSEALLHLLLPEVEDGRCEAFVQTHERLVTQLWTPKKKIPEKPHVKLPIIYASDRVKKEVQTDQSSRAVVAEPVVEGHADHRMARHWHAEPAVVPGAQDGAQELHRPGEGVGNGEGDVLRRTHESHRPQEGIGESFGSRSKQ